MSASDPDPFVYDDEDNVCFACSPHNPEGLQLRFQKASDGDVEVRYTVPARYQGAPGVIHGGIQATLLDEVLGHAIHARYPDEPFDVVTVDFQIRYRRPAPTEVPLRIRGRVVERDGLRFEVEGEILGPGDDGTETVLTRASAHWRRIGPRAGEGGE